MGGEWARSTWGDLCVLDYGKALTGYADRPSTVRVYGTNGPIGWHDTALWDGPGLIIGRKGAYRGVHFSNVPYWVIDTAYSLRPKSNFNLKWAYYALSHEGLAHIDDGSPIPSTTRASFYHVSVLVPPRRDQDAMVEVLDAFDAKIALNRRMAGTLEEIAQALFQSWFIDFDPVHAKAEGHSACLPDNLATLFPPSFDEIGLPAGWRAGTLAEVAALNPQSWTRMSMPQIINYVDLASVSWGRIEAVQIVSRGEAPSRAQRVVAPGDTIVGTVRPGNGSYAYISTESLTASTGFAVLRPASKRRGAFVYLAATRRKNIEALAHLADGAAYPAVRPEVVAATPLALPDDHLLDVFDVVVSPILNAVAERAKQSETLAALRDTLLPKLISGELRARDAETIAAGV